MLHGKSLVMKACATVMILITLQVSGQTRGDWEILKTGITEHLHDVEFINDSTGFIYSYGTGNIYRTTDAGCVWTRIWQADSLYLEQMQFIGPDLGWICGEQGTVIRTDDGGRTWDDLTIIQTEGNLLLYGMCFLDDSTGHVAGAVLSGTSLKPKVFQTRDGGRTWSEILEDIPYMILNLYQKGNELFATGTGIILRISIPSGEWEYAFIDSSGTVGQIRDIRFAGDSLGMGVSFKGMVLVTRDGGHSFRYEKISANRLRSLAYLGQNRWIAAGDNNKNDVASLYTTVDNGESWEKHGDFPDIHRLASSGNYIWMVGKGGFIAKRKR